MQCPYHLLNDEAYIRGVLVNAAELSKSQLLAVSSHKFDPHGVTAVALLAEVRQYVMYLHVVITPNHLQLQSSCMMR